MEKRLHKYSPVLLLTALMVLLMTYGCTALPEGDETEGAKKVTSTEDGIVIHLHSGTEDPNAALMGLTMAKNFSSTNPVIVYCDLEAINLLMEDAANVNNTAYGSSHVMINTLLDHGVPIYACPSCLKSHNKTDEDLIPRVQIASKTALLSFTKGRIITLDY
ncbi:DsrE family protein [Planctomycetota bacterium]|nr:DsrE family protein [Planctomycetota bacterium]